MQQFKNAGELKLMPGDLVIIDWTVYNGGMCVYAGACGGDEVNGIRTFIRCGSIDVIHTWCNVRCSIVARFSETYEIH